MKSTNKIQIVKLPTPSNPAVEDKTRIKNQDQLIDFGKYRGKRTFKELFDKDGGYCRWFVNASAEPKDFLKTPQTNPQSADLIEYIEIRLKLEGGFPETKKGNPSLTAKPKNIKLVPDSNNRAQLVTQVKSEQSVVQQSNQRRRQNKPKQTQ